MSQTKQNRTASGVYRDAHNSRADRYFQNFISLHVTHSTVTSFKPMSKGGPGNVVGIATGYVLDGPGIESRWEARFFAPVQTGPGGHPASCTIGTGSFPGAKSGRGVTLTPQPPLVQWS
jgi:hypothetical protein